MRFVHGYDATPHPPAPVGYTYAGATIVRGVPVSYTYTGPDPDEMVTYWPGGAYTSPRWRHLRQDGGVYLPTGEEVPS